MVSQVVPNSNLKTLAGEAVSAFAVSFEMFMAMWSVEDLPQ